MTKWYEGGKNYGCRESRFSLPEPLVTQIDRLAKKAGVSRSAFVRQAVERTLQESTPLVRAAYQIYAEVGEEDRKLSETFLLGS